MIAKKNPGVDLERKRMVFFNIGLLTASAFTLAAFTYSSPLESLEEKSAVNATEIEYMAIEKEVPKVKDAVQDKPRVPEVQEPAAQNVGSSTAISSTVVATTNSSTMVKSTVGSNGPVGTKVPFTGTVVVNPEAVDEFPDIDASFIGGRQEMLLHMADVQEYPAIDLELGNQGTIYVAFIVEVDGRITNVKAIGSDSKTLDREAERIVRSFPKWKPGENKFGPVRTRVRLPIKFVIAG